MEDPSLAEKFDKDLNLHEALLAFHRAMDVPAFTTPSVPSTERVQLRARILLEEAVEHLEAIGCDETAVSVVRTAVASAIETSRREFVSLPLVADSHADVIYVAIGNDLEYGIPGREVFRQVHAANMRKAGGPRRADGKVGKPLGWQGPDVEGVLRKYGWKG